MADEIAALKQLQAGLNAAFESIFSTAEKDPKNAAALGAAKEQLIGLSHATAGVAMGPAFSVISLSAAPLHYMAVRVAIDLKVFETVAANSKPTTLEEIVEKTQADPTLVKRIIRLVNAIGYVKQTGPTQWEATPLTHTMTIPPLKNWAIAHFDKRLEIYGRYPGWLKKHQWKKTWDDENDIYREVHGGLRVWEYYEQNPEENAIFDSAMSVQESFPPEMTPPYTFLAETGDMKNSADAVALVDVGGGAGQAIVALKKTYPNIPGKFILQDLPKTIAALPPNHAKDLGFEPMAHDFFKPQPIKGAKYYHFRRVFHDWNDEISLKILAATRPALNPSYSRLLIHDFVLPDFNAGPMEGTIDLMMMSTCDGKERTESEWHDLLDKAGFRIEMIYRAETGTTSVIEAVVV